MGRDLKRVPFQDSKVFESLLARVITPSPPSETISLPLFSSNSIIKFYNSSKLNHEPPFDRDTACMVISVHINDCIAAKRETNITVYGPAELDSEVSRAFLACLQNTGVEYKVYVDTAGAAVVVPAAKRSIDFDGVDTKLLECIMQVNHLMHVVTESSIHDQDEHENAVAGHSVTHEWSSEQGAKGKTEISTRPGTANPANNTSAVAGSRRDTRRSERSTKRQTGLLFFSFPSYEEDCTSYDFQINGVAPNCPNIWSAYSSIKFENPESDVLLVDIYPHHHCKEGNERQVLSNGHSLGLCQEKRTRYSWMGRFRRCLTCSVWTPPYGAKLH